MKVGPPLMSLVWIGYRICHCFLDDSISCVVKRLWPPTRGGRHHGTRPFHLLHSLGVLQGANGGPHKSGVATLPLALTRTSTQLQLLNPSSSTVLNCPVSGLSSSVTSPGRTPKSSAHSSGGLRSVSRRHLHVRPVRHLVFPYPYQVQGLSASPL